MKWIRLQKTLVSLEAGLLLFITLTGCAQPSQDKSSQALKNNEATEARRDELSISSRQADSLRSREDVFKQKKMFDNQPKPFHGDRINPSELKAVVYKVLTENGFRANVEFQLTKQESTELKRFENAGVIGDFCIYTAVIYASLPPERRCVAVAPGGKAYMLPNGINNLLSETFKKDFDKNKAIQIAELYAVISSTAPDSCKLLHSANDIPTNKKEPVDPRLVEVVNAPRVHKTAQGYTVTACFWYNVGGDIKQFKFHLDKQGKMIDKEEKTIAKRIGNYDVRQ